MNDYRLLDDDICDDYLDFGGGDGSVLDVYVVMMMVVDVDLVEML